MNQEPQPPDKDGLSPEAQPTLRRAQKRRLHRRHVARRAAASLVMVVILAALSYGLVLWLGDDHPSKTGAAVAQPTETAQDPDVSASSGSESLSHASAPTGFAASDGQTAEEVLSSSTSSSLQPNLSPRLLTAETNPEITNLAITLQDGTVLTGKTPFEGEVPGGDIKLSFRKKGYKVATRELALQEPQSLKVWLDPEGLLHESLIRYKCGAQPKQVAFSPDGSELWVTLLAGSGVEIYEPSTGEKIDQIRLGDYGAVEVVFTKDGSKVYASQMETASVFEIDRATRKVLRTFKTGGEWTKVLLLSPDENTLWASNWISNDISEIDLTTGKLVRLLRSVVTPRGLYVTPDGQRLFVAGFENGDIQRIDLVTEESKILYKTGGAMRHMVGDDERGLLYVDDLSTKEVFVVDLATEQVTKLADTDERPNTMDLSPDGKVLYVSNRGKDNPDTYLIPGPEWGSILAIDTASGDILDAIVGGNQCTGLDVSPDGSLLAFSDFLDNKIRVYTIPDYETLASGGGGRAVTHLADLAKE